MKIGIMTFHWAVNYGAVLQAYALQTYLRSAGHDAFMIDYKPRNRDYNLANLILNRKFPHPFQYMKEAAEDKVFEEFRRKYLVRTRRYGSLDELRNDPPEGDIYISGSDQVLHPRTLMKGERRPAPAYMLDFGPEAVLRAGYAVSFGCTAYPPQAAALAGRYISRFDVLSVRETTGADVARSLGYRKPLDIVPDPVILAGPSVYEPVLSEVQACACGHTATYLLRRKDNLDALIGKDFGDVRPLTDCTVPQWVSGIRDASRLVTNSFHGTVFALLFHVPFISLLETGAAAGMNDRFTTLLSRLGLQGRILPGYDSRQAETVFGSPIEWQTVDSLMEAYADEGRRFIDGMLRMAGS